ncbi:MULTISPECIES: site-specific integrase [Bacteroidales]|uniref:site-specific integrase n=1 Tax=Bacteroidales TaxID=171549 RepID=UPI0004728C42|nr:site-specific integrase [Porphyromonas gingivicanis]
MKKDKMKVLLYLKKGGLNKAGLAPIMGRITYDRTMAQFSSKLSCNPKLWNVRESRLNGKSQEAVETNANLERLLLSIQEAYQVLCERGVEFTATDIKEAFQGCMQGRVTLLQQYDRMVEEAEKRIGTDIKRQSFAIYRNTRKQLSRFILNHYKVKDLTFTQIEDDFLDNFQHYAKSKLGYSQAYFCRLAQLVKKTCKMAFNEGITERPILDFVKIEKGDAKMPRALDKASFEKLQSLKLNEYEKELETARNLFLFSCYTGVSYCDMMCLNQEHLFLDDEGKSWLKFQRQKTDSLSRVKLLPEAEHIIEKYSSEERDTLFPNIPYTTYRYLLKGLQHRAGITIPITAHVGRHTFATLITLENGVPIETVSRMLGHRRIETTERYAHVTPTKLFDEFERFISFTKDLTLTL